MRRKEERRKQGQTNIKAKQHSTPKAVMYMYIHVYKYTCILGEAGMHFTAIMTSNHKERYTIMQTLLMCSLRFNDISLGMLDETSHSQ